MATKVKPKITKQVEFCQKTSTYVEDDKQKELKRHPLCGLTVDFDYALFEKKGNLVVKIGSQTRQGKIVAVYKDLTQIVCGQDTHFIPLTQIRYDY